MIHSIKKLLSQESISPHIQNEFQNVQIYLLKFSIPGFENQFTDNMGEVEKSKKMINKAMISVSDSLFKDIFEEHSQNLKNILNEYYGLVIDGTLSAAAMKDFEMASYIATTTGVELRTKFDSELSEIKTHIEKTKSELESEVSTIMSRTILMIVIGMIIGTIAFLFTFFKLIPMLTKPVRKFKELLGEYSLGNFEQKMSSDSKDEFGQMAEMLNKLRDSQLEKIEAAERIACRRS